MSKRDVIVDVGMHDGKDAFYYNKRGFNVIAFEANPTLVDKIKSSLNGKKIDVRNRAISNEKGNLTFHVNNFNTTWSSLDPELGQRKEGSVEISVPSCNLEDELRDICSNILFVKIDIEGYDQVALRQILRLPTLPLYISVENGSVEMIENLDASGYEYFKFSNQKYVPFQKIPPNSPHGEIVEHTFLSSSSGLFGDDLPGRWFTKEEALQIMNGLIACRKSAPGNLWADAIGWFDLHAKRTE